MEHHAEELNYTVNAWEQLYDVVDNSYFLDKDSELIYHALEKKIHSLSFGEFLKRYLYTKAEIEEPFESVSLSEYQQIIRDSFQEYNTPKSFEESSAKLGALSKNWLTQKSVNRKVVFLLGFGLGMDVEDVDEFLQKALREKGINPKDPFEVLCWYCYRNHYRYPKFESLWTTYQKTPAQSVDLALLFSDRTIGYRQGMISVEDDAHIISFVTKLKNAENISHISVTAGDCFRELYGRARELVANLYNTSEDFAETRKAGQKFYTAEEITPGDLEHIISSAIPVGGQGNLVPARLSSLNTQFDGKRFSRQRVTEILSDHAEVNRFDLITLNFFIYSQTLDAYDTPKGRYSAFIEDTNDILNKCYMGELYVGHPYECFILMCLLSEEPLGTYADVLEMSYSSEEMD